MFSFFRKYQKVVLGLVTILIVSSFLFYGTASTFSGQASKKTKDKKTVLLNGEKIDGDKLAIYAFMLTEGSNAKNLHPKQIPWLLSDDFFLEEFIQSGLLGKLVAHHEEALSEDYQKRLEHVKKCHLFAHPQASEISLERVWMMFAPRLYQAWVDLKRLENPTAAQMADALARFYSEFKKFPQSHAKQILASQISQYSPEQASYFLAKVDITPLGFETIEDFFGENTVHLALGYFLHIAQEAKKHGIQVSKRDIKKHMLFCAKTQLAKMHQVGYRVELKKSQIEKEILKQLTSYHITKASAKGYLAELLRIQKYLQKCAGEEEINLNKDAFVKWKLKKISLHPQLQLHSYTDFLASQCYLEGLCNDYNASSLLLPFKTRSVEELTQNCPEILAKEYVFQSRYVNKGKLAGMIPLKEIIAYQISDEGWKYLAKQNIKLVSSTHSESERASIIDRMEAHERQKLDQITTSRLLELYPEKGLEGLEKQKWNEKKVTYLGNGKTQDLPFIKDQEKFFSKLQENKDFLFEEDSLLFEVMNVQEKGDWQILSYEKAKTLKAVDFLVEKKLAAWGVKARTEEKIQEQCKKAYAPLFKALEEFSFSTLHKKITNPDELLPLRFAPLLIHDVPVTFMDFPLVIIEDLVLSEEQREQASFYHELSWEPEEGGELVLSKQEGPIRLYVGSKEPDIEGYENEKQKLLQKKLQKEKYLFLEKILEEMNITDVSYSSENS